MHEQYFVFSMNKTIAPGRMGVTLEGVGHLCNGVTFSWSDSEGCVYHLTTASEDKPLLL